MTCTFHVSNTIFLTASIISSGNKNSSSSLILFTDGFFNIHTFNVRSLVWVLTSNHEIKKYPGIVIEIPNKNE